MTKHVHVLLWVPLIYACFFVLYWIRIFSNEYISFENHVLEKQVNYAADSATDAMLVDSNLGLDYADEDFINLDPEVAKKDFFDTLCIDFGYLVNDTSTEILETKNVKALVVCTYDGMYAYYRQRTDNQGGYGFVQTPKIPYTYTAGDTQYILTLDKEKGYEATYSGGEFHMNRLDNYEHRPTNDLQSSAINNQVANLLNWALYETYSGGKDVKVTLPALGNHIMGAQPVDRPTVISVVEGNEKVFSTAITAECIGGAQITEADPVTGYTLQNCSITSPIQGTVVLSGKYYAKNSWWKEHASYFNNTNALSDAKHFDNAFEAACAGYNDLGLIE